MKLKFFIIILGVLVFSSVVFGGDIGIFFGEASVEIGAGTPVAAKIIARNEALKQAVTKAVRQVILPKEFTAKEKAINKNILRKAGAYIQSYEILEAYSQAGHYIIKLEARVKLDVVVKDIAKLGVRASGTGDPEKRVFLVTTFRRMDEEKFWPSLFDPLSSRFEVIDLKTLSSAKAEDFLATTAFMRYQERNFDEFYDGASGIKARYALVIRSLVTHNDQGICPSLGTARFLDLGNRVVLAKIEFQFQPEVGCEQAATMAAKEIFAGLALKLKGKGIFDSPPVMDLRLSFVGLGSYKDTSQVSAYLKRIPGVKSVALHSFGTGGKVIFRLHYEGATDDLINALKRFKPVGFTISKRVTRDDSLLYEAEY